MKKIITVILLTICTLTMSADRQSDRRQAEQYDRTAASYQSKADGYYREAERYKRQAQTALDDADYYLRGDRASNALTQVDRAKTAIKNYESYMSKAKSAESTAQEYRRKAERLRR